jgi:hypothetical protein
MKVNREGKDEDESETIPHFNFNILYFDHYFFVIVDSGPAFKP